MTVDQRLHMRDTGEGPVLVLLHAFPCDGRLWETQAQALVAAGWRVLVPDLPGFGSSPLPDEAPSLDVVAALVVEALELAGVDRCLLGGVSLGGYVAMAILRTRPDLVSGLILCDTKATADSAAARENREQLAQMCLAEPEQTARILERAVLPGLLGDTTRAERPDVVDAVRGWLEEASAEAVAWYQRAMAARPDSLATLAAAPIPTLVLFGSEDVLSPAAEQRVMVAAMADAGLIEVPRAGHLALVEEPDAVSTAMRQFARLVRGPQTS